MMRKEVSSFRLLLKFNWSNYLFLVLLAGLFWGFLPISYAKLNADPAIAAQPFLTVGMRFLLATIMISMLVGVTWIFSCIWSKRGKDKTTFHYIIERSSQKIFSQAIIFITLASLFYFGARVLEMKYLLTFSVANTEIVENAQGSLENIMYPLPQQSDSNDISQSISSTLQKAVNNSAQSFGYFMGLVLIMGWSFKGWLMRSFFHWSERCDQKWTKNKLIKEFVNITDRFPNATGMIYWSVSLFLVIIAGALLLYAREPIYSTHYAYILPMLGWAIAIGLFTSFFLDFNILGSLLDEDKVKEISLSWKDHVVSSTLCCLILSVLVALAAFVCGFPMSGMTMSETCLFLGRYFIEGRGISLVFTVVLFGSLLAPIMLITGVTLYDEKKKRFDGKAVSGADWQRISSCFEPLFVLIVGVTLVPLMGSGGESFVNMTAMWLAIGAVFLIALLKMAEVWGEKSADIRQSAFVARRDELMIFHKCDLPKETLFDNALELSKLKFYSSRHKLEQLKLQLSKEHINCDTSKLSPELLEFFHRAERYLFQNNSTWAISNKTPRVNMIFLENGYTFFNADDPQSQDTLAAHFSFLEDQKRVGNKMISMDWMMSEMELSSGDTKRYKKAIVDYGIPETTMPILILNDDPDEPLVEVTHALVAYGTSKGKTWYSLKEDFKHEQLEVPIDKKTETQDAVLDLITNKLEEEKTLNGSTYDWLFIDVEVWNAIALMPEIRNGEKELSDLFTKCRVVWFGSEIEATFMMQALGFHHESCMPFLKLPLDSNDITEAQKKAQDEALKIAYDNACLKAEKRFETKPQINIFINTEEKENQRFDKLNLTRCYVSLALVGTGGTMKNAENRKEVEDICQEKLSFVPQNANECALTFMKTVYKTWNENGLLPDLVRSIHDVPYAFNLRAFKSPMKDANKVKKIMNCSLESVADAVAYHCGVRGEYTPWSTPFLSVDTIKDEWRLLFKEINISVSGTLEREVNYIILEHFKSIGDSNGK